MTRSCAMEKCLVGCAKPWSHRLCETLDPRLKLASRKAIGQWCAREAIACAGSTFTRPNVCYPLMQARDCAVTRESRSVWRRVLGHNATLRNPRDLAACMLQVHMLYELG